MVQGRFKKLIKAEGTFTQDQLDFIGCRQRQLELSRQMTRLVDVLYALVLVQGAVYYRSLFTMEDEFLHLSDVLPVVLALFFIYFTAIQSFVDYHLASEDQPYQMLDRERRGKDLNRFYLDVVIVGLYSFLLLKCHALLLTPEADLWPVFAALLAVFALYWIWGELREATSQPGGRTYGRGLIFLCLFFCVVLLGAYTQVHEGWIANAACLFVALLIMAFYRWHNWLQNRRCEGQPAVTEPGDEELKALATSLTNEMLDQMGQKLGDDLVKKRLKEICEKRATAEGTRGAGERRTAP